VALRGRAVTAVTLTAAGQQLSTTADAFVNGAIQNTSAVTAVNTALQISPDNVTYTSVQLVIIPTTTVGSFIVPVGCLVPAGWWIRWANLNNAAAQAGAWY
jgi:hypothetical protein